MVASNDESLKALIAKVQGVNPYLVDCWQAVAIIESLGYTDRLIQEEFNFPDALALGRYVYGCCSATPIPTVSLEGGRKSQSHHFPKRHLLQEVEIFLKEFSRSFVYAVPLIMTTMLAYLPNESTLQVFPPELSSVLALATLISLVTSGGFVQMISRRGVFYLQLGEMGQLRQSCLSFLILGMSVSLLLSCLATWFGFYRNLVADQYLILANLYYWFLSTLWMLFAILSILMPWGTPLALCGLTLLFLALRVWLNLGAIESQVLTMGVTFVAIALTITLKLRMNGRHVKQKLTAKPPRLSALVYLMAPYFLYGVSYFMFLFADRIVAGLALQPNSGLFYAVDSSYQRSMDLALLNFLLLVPFVEYLSFIFIRYWYQKAKTLSVDSIPFLSSRLLRHHRSVVIAAVVFFWMVLAVIFVLVKPDQWQASERFLSFVGSVGYLLLSIGLLNALILFSLDQASAVFKAFFPALVLNLSLGYLCSHLIGAPYAVLGLMAGATVFMVYSSRCVITAIKQPDRMYYLGGY